MAKRVGWVIEEREGEYHLFSVTYVNLGSPAKNWVTSGDLSHCEFWKQRLGGV